MKKYQRVAMLKTCRSLVLLPTDSYIFEPTGKFIWLKKMIWDILLKTSLKQYFREVDEVYYKDINCDSLNALVQSYITEAIASNHKFPENIYMGCEEFNSICCESNTQIQNQLCITLDDKRLMGYGYQLHVLPNMKGVLVV